MPAAILRISGKIEVRSALALLVASTASMHCAINYRRIYIRIPIRLVQRTPLSTGLCFHVSFCHVKHTVKNPSLPGRTPRMSGAHLKCPYFLLPYIVGDPPTRCSLPVSPSLDRCLYHDAFLGFTAYLLGYAIHLQLPCFHSLLQDSPFSSPALFTRGCCLNQTFQTPTLLV
jgi:hypothetical protein